MENEPTVEPKDAPKKGKRRLTHILLFIVGGAAALLLLSAALGAALLWNRYIRMPGESAPRELPLLSQLEEALLEPLREDVRLLCDDIGERHVPGAAASLVRAAEYIEAQLRAAGVEPEREYYEAGGHRVWNVVADFAGAGGDGGLYVVGAHYDTVPGSPGADDNTSAVAGALAVARHFAGRKTEHALRVVFFVNEEQPYAHSPLMGSYVNAERASARGDNVRGMICLEMIGFYSDEEIQRYPLDALKHVYPKRADFVALVSTDKYGEFLRECVDAFRRHATIPSEGLAAPPSLRDIARSDHWSFWQFDVPAIMVTDTSEFRYTLYHTAEDTPDKLDFGRLARTTAGVIGLLEELTGAGD